MRITLLTRSVIATAALGIGVGLLTAPPVSAAAPGVTRAQVLAAVEAARAEPDPEAIFLSRATTRAARTLANSVCKIDHAKELMAFALVKPTEDGQGAEGVVVTAIVQTLEAQDLDDYVRYCTFGAFTSTKPGGVLTGNSTLNFGSTVTTKLSGETAVTGTLNHTYAQIPGLTSAPVLTATGTSNLTTKSTTTKKVATKKSKAQIKTAKTRYAKQLKAAKAKYTKAIKKAGKSQKAKNAAKKVYNAKKKSLRASYKKAVATHRTVTTTTTSTAKAPFNLHATSRLFPLF